jgi:hexulose-6-phosphate isomerase
MVSINKTKIGIVQGRLVPPVDGKIQAFPKKDWEKEIRLVKRAGFDGFEWIFDSEDNPIFSQKGRNKISELISANNVDILSISADYLVSNPIFGKTKEKSIEILKELIVICDELKIPRINVPLEDGSELKNPTDIEDAIDSLEQCLPLAEKTNVILMTECSLPPMNLLAFMKRVNHRYFKVNYDLGNSCACGYPTDFALGILADYLGGIHIKDRTELFGKTVAISTGDTDFATHFKTLKEIGYSGYYVIQGARGKDDFETAKIYLEYIRNLLASA